MCLLIRIVYTFDSVYTKGFLYGRFDDERIYVCMYVRKLYICIKGFSIDLIKMIFMKLGQKSIDSCIKPFTGSKSKL